MRGFSLRRRRVAGKAREGRQTWQDTVPARDSGPGQSRYLHIPEIDRWRAVPFAMTPIPERPAVMERVQQLMSSLDGAVDEGTGATLDNLIESWAGSWIASVDSEYVDHCAVISVHRGQARQWLTEAHVTVQHIREELEQVRADLQASRRRLTGEAPSPAPPGMADVPDLDGGAEPDGRAAEPGAPGSALSSEVRLDHRLAPRQDWSEPHLVAGRGVAGVVVGAVLVLVGALADTIAFHNVLELVLRTESATLSWVMAAGTTSMALVSAGTLGVARAIRRRVRHFPPRHRPSRLPLIVSAVVWVSLGLAMFLIRWRDQGAVSGLDFGQTQTQGAAQSPLWQAIFFAAIYFISGACTMFEAERLYNPEYFAFRRLRKQYRKQAESVAKAEAASDRAEAALELHDGELQREDQRRIAAIADRRALAAEAANYARVLMAGMMRDPAKTGVTETGPVPDMSASFGGGRPAAGAGAGPAGRQADGSADAP
jgi:hypothetical protein